MAVAVATIEIDCPRCSHQFTGSVVATPRAAKPGRRKSDTLDLDLRCVDLALRFSEHYEHACPANPANRSTQ